MGEGRCSPRGYILPGAWYALLAPPILFALPLVACTSILVSPQPPGSPAAAPATTGQAGGRSAAEERSSPAAGFDRAPQRNEAGSVTVEVMWGATGTATPTFAVSLDTHSVDLDAYDLQQLALLRTDQGIEARPAAWDAPKGGHHRSGTLTFPEVAPDGRPLVAPATRRVELLIRDVAGVPERSFLWTR
ncbi:MAG: hypothetical protein HYY05_05840 [Chloroflexi bacterium]|nr:hypothetical protein [Chloroflexota bacterium]